MSAEGTSSPVPPPATTPSALSRWRWSITAGFALGGVTVAAWGPRLPAIKERLGIDTTTIGLLLAGVTVGGIVGVLSSTPVAHRLGSRRAIATALLVVGAALGLLGVALELDSLPLLVAGFVVVGAGIGTLDVLINVEGSAIERAARRTLLPRMHAAWSIGVAVGSGIGAASAALDVSPAAQFLVEAALVAVAGAVVARGVPRWRRPGDEATAGDRRARRRQWRRSFLDVRLLLIGLVMLGVELGEGSATSWLTLAARSDHGEAPAVAAAFFVAFAAGEALSRMFGGSLVDRIGRVATLRVTTSLGVLGVVLFIRAGTPWLVLVGTLLWSVGVSMGFPLGMSAAAESGPDPAARVSVVGSIGYFANLAGPPAIGALAQRAGLLQALWVVVGLFVAAFAASGSLGDGRTGRSRRRSGRVA